jgi:hypothetical protein
MDSHKFVPTTEAEKAMYEFIREYIVEDAPKHPVQETEYEMKRALHSFCYAGEVATKLLQALNTPPAAAPVAAQAEDGGTGSVEAWETEPYEVRPYHAVNGKVKTWCVAHKQTGETQILANGYHDIWGEENAQAECNRLNAGNGNGGGA